MHETWHIQLTKEVQRRIIFESIERIKKCLSELTEDEIWKRPNENTVSVGNLVIHLIGNVKQWLISAMGNIPDHRDREKEFSEIGPISINELFSQLDELATKIEQVLRTLQAEDLLKDYNVQGYKESGIAILIHITEHFSYHTGQITLHVKMIRNMDMGYYKGHNLNAKNDK